MNAWLAVAAITSSVVDLQRIKGLGTATDQISKLRHAHAGRGGDRVSDCLRHPIGYATHLRVYGPGDYRFSDYLRCGAPLNLLMWLLAVLIIPHIRTLS